MFKYKVFFSILLLSPLFSWAQYKPKFFEIGPKIGLNLGGMATLDTVTYKKKIAANYQAGIFTRFNVGKFSLQPEFIYQSKGATFTKPNSAKYAYKYLSTPILLGFTPAKGIYLETGAELSWSLNQGYKPQGLTVFGPDAATDKSWVIGARINMLDMLSLVSINLRYTHGLTDQSNLKIGNTPVDFRNRTFQLSATYAFSEYWTWKRKYGVKKNR
jgi:Outer membrane protein beta-barrel domain